CMEKLQWRSVNTINTAEDDKPPFDNKYLDSLKVEIDILKNYIEGSKTFVQLSSAGLVLPLILRGDVAKLIGDIGKFTLSETIFISISWFLFLIAIGSGALYQYAVVKFMEYLLNPGVYVRWPLTYLVKKSGPGLVYGAMVVSFYIGAICVVAYAFNILLRMK